MITMNELVDLRMQQQIAQEIIYRQQIMQRIPDPFAAAMMPSMHLPPHMLMPAHPPLPGVEAKLENKDLWQQFHKIGTEMIITKTGRRMFPSMRVSLKGLEEESQYCVLIEMVPVGDCRYKFSGSQWVPAGGAEPQSPQRMYLHPDSPATGSHWQAQPILFNKVKLTNNTLDNNGHVVLASMHKYQPRIHVIRTNDLSQIPWAPQQAFVFPETEFVAVTAYQNDRITKLKIDNNPFAKGFRETGQSKCKRKMSLSPALSDDQNANSSSQTDDDQSSIASSQDSPPSQNKRFCSREEPLPYMDLNGAMRYAMQQQSAASALMNEFAPAFFPQMPSVVVPPSSSMYMNHAASYMDAMAMQQRLPFHYQHQNSGQSDNEESSSVAEQANELFVDVVSTSSEDYQTQHNTTPSASPVSKSSQSLPQTPASVASPCGPKRSNSSDSLLSCDMPTKRSSFSISSILGSNTRNVVTV
ncbi:T-box-containing protein TBX6L-like [Musca vetustissima]|uniref:T-box-containing protein TBX6L-like n=1 Tax=Musca vetustissima TaxID=27455 RepID=UPI002AB7E67D|nr:T-box-containing protein TBX6L-like [Musca vetustissima]